ncbi:MAG: copper homeostasis protein CutC [Flavobacteriales bacterium]|nr:copper homeostasis protein CutC [Flavobacteriales bacterium]
MVSVEICASTIRDVAVAMEAGAHRVELCSVWSVGGITPNVVVVEAAAAMGMPVRALIRPREGSFVHSASERSWAVEEAKVMMDCGAERAVVGALDEEGGLDQAYLEAMVNAVGAEALVWHRAIDASLQVQEDVAVLREFGVEEVLSSGGALRAVDGVAQLQGMMASGLRVIAGGGVRPQDVATLAEAGVDAVHASCRKPSQGGGSKLFDTTVNLVDYDLVCDLVGSVSDL